jgi:hypothetical protein
MTSREDVIDYTGYKMVININFLECEKREGERKRNKERSTR